MLVGIRASPGHQPEVKAGSRAISLTAREPMTTATDQDDVEQPSTSWGAAGPVGLGECQEEVLEYDESVLEEGETVKKVTSASPEQRKELKGRLVINQRKSIGVFQVQTPVQCGLRRSKYIRQHEEQKSVISRGKKQVFFGTSTITDRPKVVRAVSVGNSPDKNTLDDKNTRGSKEMGYNIVSDES
ncbi:hypothetical protein NDU88_005794 [Pleurodeles waltl]|uniref:Uncharacterized protein n=1 Tax=Pleurodeles waltl TaxID=8319 RepID=A0AAV7N5D1_PLEWA|nr:hypothetical protein NDU88_005794 [Pleurodeles waltl]